MNGELVYKAFRLLGSPNFQNLGSESGCLEDNSITARTRHGSAAATGIQSGYREVANVEATFIRRNLHCKTFNQLPAPCWNYRENWYLAGTCYCRIGGLEGGQRPWQQPLRVGTH